MYDEINYVIIFMMKSIGGYFISRYEQDAGIYYKNSKGEKIEDAGCNQYMSKKNPYGIQKT